MNNNYELIKHMISSGVLKTPRLIGAFEKIDRCHFVPKELSDLCYIDKPLPIGDDQTISQPSTVAFMLELLSPKRGDKILDIGSGSGWTSSLLCYIVGKEGSVLGVERRDSLVIKGRHNLKQFNFGDNCRIEKASPYLGMPGDKFDKVLVSASADKLPESLVEQLRVGGVLVIPVKNDILRITKIDKDSYTQESFHGFVFVPLIYDEH